MKKKQDELKKNNNNNKKALEFRFVLMSKTPYMKNDVGVEPFKARYQRETPGVVYCNFLRSINNFFYLPVSTFYTQYLLLLDF